MDSRYKIIAVYIKRIVIKYIYRIYAKSSIIFQQSNATPYLSHMANITPQLTYTLDLKSI